MIYACGYKCFKVNPGVKLYKFKIVINFIHIIIRLSFFIGEITELENNNSINIAFKVKKNINTAFDGMTSTAKAIDSNGSLPL